MYGMSHTKKFNQILALMYCPTYCRGLYDVTGTEPLYASARTLRFVTFYVSPLEYSFLLTRYLLLTSGHHWQAQLV